MIPIPDIVLGTNSYIGTLDANDYFKNRLYSDAWFDAGPGDNERALITSSQQISRFVSADYKLPLVTISEALERATCELALMMLADEDTVTNTDTGQNIKRVKAGTAEVEFVRATKGTRFPKLVMDILIEAELIAIGGTSAGEDYGTDLCSTFEGNDYGLTRGFS